MTAARSLLAAALLGLLFCASASAQETRMPAEPSLRQQTYDRLLSLVVLPLNDWRQRSIENVSRGESTKLDDSSWKSLGVGDTWSSGSLWLRRWIDIPTQINGRDLRGDRLKLHVAVDTGGERTLMIYRDESMVAMGYDPEPVVLEEQVKEPKRVLAAIRLVQSPGQSTFRKAQLEVQVREGRPDPKLVAQELMAVEALLPALGKDAAASEKVLDDAIGTIHWKALALGDQEEFDASLNVCRKVLSALTPALKANAVRAVGNAHIDMAWLWPWTETVEVTRNTFSTALTLMEEYPEFRYTQSQAAAYAWMEEKYPVLFEQIRRRVREGRWEVVGGMWVEPDLNLPDGESLARQLLHGKRYFQQKFGVDVKVGWNPDSFGYSWQLPQIYKKAGIDYFVTQKLYWNETNPFPHKLFWWEAPDGSKLLSYFPHDYVNSMDPVRIAKDVGTYAPATGYPELMHLYGIGDHGGGPTREMLDEARTWMKPERLFPAMQFGTAQGFFTDLAKKVPGLSVPVWKDELYLETHRGVQTSQEIVKKGNRRSEEAMLVAERLAAIAWASAGQSYPAAELESSWKTLLFNQFHDILPGSSIPAVYKDAARDLANVQRSAREVSGQALQALAARVDTRGAGAPVLVFNPLGWKRSEVVEATLRASPGPLELQEGMPLEVLRRDEAQGSVTVRFLAEGVPALGYRVFHVVSKVGAGGSAGTVTASDAALENKLLRVTVDRKTGCIVSLFDKRANREALAPGGCGNLLQTFRDTPKKFDAWNIDANFEDVKWDLRKAESVKLVESSPLRSAIRLVRKFQASTFTQDLVLEEGSPRLVVKNDVDWRERHVLLKAAFPAAVVNEKATFEIPYGSIERPTTRNTPVEKAKFEVPALRWADLSDGNFGVSLLNDCKYGYDVKDSVLRLSLLRSPAWPDPKADEGRHTFAYAFYPHAGGWREAGTVRQGYELNYPLVVRPEAAHEGSMPAVKSFAQIEPENVVLSALKKSEDGNFLVARFYETAGKAAEVKLSLPGKAIKAVEANLLEKDEKPLALVNGIVTVPTKPYEIKTVKVTLREVQ